MNGKKIFFGTLKWISIILIGGAGWIALLAFIVVQGFSEGGYRLGLPIGDINPDEYWKIGYEGKIPELLKEENNFIVYSRYGFTDVSQIGLVKLDDAEKENFLNNYFKNVELADEQYQFYANVICVGGADLALSWIIQSGRIEDYFDFCSQISGENSLQWKSIEFVDQESDGVGFSYMHIDHLVDTQYFIISHGKS